MATSSIPIEVEGIVPNAVSHMSRREIEKLPIFCGNHKIPLAELFQVTGDAGNGRIEWQGDLRGVHWIGAKMTSGTVHVAGNAGRHVGSEMTGGEIHVQGDASDWVGGEMHGGLIFVRGRVGHLAGAAYRGSRRGMTGGTILVGGDAGNEIGHTMRRGLLAVGGRAGDLGGFNMLAGTILVLGDCGIRFGAGMHRGTIGLFGPEPPPMLPTFRHACRGRPLMLLMVFQHLTRNGFTVPENLSTAEFDHFHGDMIEGGRGEIFLRT
jgi:formylmethanofuran dehydrogenase subunit C